MKKGLHAMMKHLYEGGVLLQSIIEPKKEDENAFAREYFDDLQVYLSLRGNQLYQMLKVNSLLFEAYRDDIDTDLEDNAVMTLKMSKFRRIKYCILYTDYLFQKEIGYLRNNSDKELLSEELGKEIVTVALMKGLRESIVKYYYFESQEKTILIELYNKLAMEINAYLNEIDCEEQILERADAIIVS